MSLAAAAVMVTACTTGGGDGLASERECRSIERQGSKMRDSVCLSAEEWAQIDAEAAEQSAAASDLLRQVDDYNAQNPVSPGDSYNPYPAGGY